MWGVGELGMHTPGGRRIFTFPAHGNYKAPAFHLLKFFGMTHERDVTYTVQGLKTGFFSLQSAMGLKSQSSFVLRSYLMKL